MSECAGAPIGVVIVHGIGDPKPGETLDSLVEGLCGRNKSLTIEASGRRVLAGSSFETEIVVRQQRLVNKTSGTTIFVSEVFWGDVGKVGAGWWSVLTAVASLAMGLHALIFAGGGVSGREPRGHLPQFRHERTWFRAAFWTAFVGAYHIKGVLTPLAALMLLLVALSLVSGTGTPPSVTNLIWLPVIGLLALKVPGIMPTVAGAFWGLVGYVVPVCGALLATSVLGRTDGWLVGLVFSAAFSLCHTVLVAYTVRCDWQSGIGGFAKKAAFWAAAIPWIVFAVLLRQRDGGLVMRDLGSIFMSAYHVAFGLAALWVFAIGTCCSVSAFTEDAKQRERGKVIFLGYGCEFSLWVVIATTLGWLAWQLPDHERLIWLGVETAYGPGTWFPLVPIVFVASLAVALLIAQIFFGFGKRSKFEIADLVGSWPLPVMTLVTALVCVKAVANALNLPLLQAIDVDPLIAKIGAALLPVLVSLVKWSREPLLHGLDLANDVALYFRGRSWASGPLHRRDELLKARFTAVADDLVSDHREKPLGVPEQTADSKVGRLVVVAHSQGTVIAADALRDWVNTSKVDLLTMGSPLRGLYARFFGVYFCTLVPNVRSAAKSWVNLYRGDDYVGRRLDGGVTDILIEGKGHEGYWTDASVLAELEGLIGLQEPRARSDHTRQGSSGTDIITESL